MSAGLTSQAVHTLLDLLPTGLVVAELDTGVLRWNRRALDLHGYVDGDGPQASFHTVAHNHRVQTLDRADVPVDRWPLLRLTHGEEFSDYELWVSNRAQGQERVFSYSGVIVPDSEPRIGMLTILDITDRHRAERAARESQQLLRTTMDNFPAVIAFKDREHRFLDVSPFVERTLGTAKDALIGRTVNAYLPADAVAALDRTDDEVMASRRARQVPQTIPLPTGDLHFIDMNFPLVDADDRVYGTGHISLDVTEMKRIEVALRSANEQLQHADEMKTQFLATLAHELRNPLAPLMSALEILGRSTEVSITAAARAMMARQLAHLVRLVDDLLDVSRITTGKMRLNQERLEVARVVEQAIETARPTIDSRRHRLVLEPMDREFRVCGDPVRLAQILTNLLNNAARYTPPGGTITMRVLQGAPGRVRISVTDTGVGLGPDALARIFQLFVQIATDADGAHGGLGIGLALARQLAEMHEGTLEAASDGAGHGATFTLDLPTAPALVPTLPAHADGDQPSRMRCRVVVVDDSRDAADSLAIMLKLSGHEVSTAYDGLAGIAAIRTHRPDVAVVDIGMPGCDGFEVARTLRAEAWSDALTLIALTGWGQDEDKRRTAVAGFDYHFTKPVESSAIEAVLAQPHRAAGRASRAPSSVIAAPPATDSAERARGAGGADAT